MALEYSVTFSTAPPYRTFVVRVWDPETFRAGAGKRVDTKRVVPATYWRSLGRDVPRELPDNEKERRKIEQLAIAWAVTAVAKIEEELTGRRAGGASAEVLLDAMLEWYIAENPNSGEASTIAKYQDCRKRLVGYFGTARRPSTINAGDVVAYRNAMQDRKPPLRNRTIKNDVVFLKQTITYAYEQRSRTGVREILLLKLPHRWITKQRTQRRPLTEDELARIIRVRLPRGGDRVVKVVIFAFTTGMRKWPLLNFERTWRNASTREIRVPGWAMKGGENRWGDEDFVVPICQWAVDVSQPDDRHGRWLWPNPRTMKPNTQLDVTLAAIAQKAGVAKFCLQDLRNTFASILADAGVHEQVIAVLQGHAASSVTREYIKSQPTALRDAVAKMDELRKKLESLPENVRRMRA